VEPSGSECPDRIGSLVDLNGVAHELASGSVRYRAAREPAAACHDPSKATADDMHGVTTSSSTNTSTATTGRGLGASHQTGLDRVDCLPAEDCAHERGTRAARAQEVLVKTFECVAEEITTMTASDVLQRHFQRLVADRANGRP